MVWSCASLCHGHSILPIVEQKTGREIGPREQHERTCDLPPVDAEMMAVRMIGRDVEIAESPRGRSSNAAGESLASSLPALVEKPAARFPSACDFSRMVKFLVTRSDRSQAVT
jgi:hypothetical protein